MVFEYNCYLRKQRYQNYIGNLQVLVNQNHLYLDLILIFFYRVTDIVVFRLKNLLDSRFCYTTALTRGGPANSVATQNNQVTRGRPPYRGEVVEHNQGRIILNLKPIRYDGLIVLNILLKKCNISKKRKSSFILKDNVVCVD